MFPGLNRFNEIEFCDENPLLNNSQTECSKKSEIQLVNTSPFETKQLEETIFSRSLRQKPGDFEISFETNLSKQHEATFIKSVSKFIETVFVTRKLSSKNFLDHNLFRSDFLEQPTEDSYNHLLTSNLLIPTKQRDQFIVDLKFEEGFEQFMKFVCTQTFQQIGAQFFFLSWKIWEKYIQIRQFVQNEEDLLTRGTQFIQNNFSKFFRASSLKYLNLEKADPKPQVPLEVIQAATKEFLLCFTHTILLVIDGYFANPYYSIEQKSQKRSHRKGSKILSGFLSDEFSDDQEFSKGPQKKIKI